VQHEQQQQIWSDDGISKQLFMEHGLQTLYTVFREGQYEHAMKENQKVEDKPFNLFFGLFPDGVLCDITIS
jgi:hypothetical protein